MIVRLLFTLLLLSNIPLRSPAQTQKDYAKIDKHAIKAPQEVGTEIKKLANYLQKATTTDLEKVRSIYVWITHNIHYDEQAYKNGQKRINRSNEDVLQRKKAVCFGYATLFKALCDEMELESVLISGYSRGTLTSSPTLDEPDHAWNAVKIEENWQLLDATWGSSTLRNNNAFLQTNSDDYFLVEPQSFVLTHLPQDPMWQLLDCPISGEDFQASKINLTTLLKDREPCFDFRDSIRQYQLLSSREQKIKTAENALRFNPTKAMKEELASTYIDQAGILSDQVEAFVGTDEPEKTQRLQQEIIRLFKKSIPLMELKDWQWELYIGTLINHAVLIYNSSSAAEQHIAITQAIDYLKAARDLLPYSTNDYFRKQAESQCHSYLQFLEEALKN